MSAFTCAEEISKLAVHSSKKYHSSFRKLFSQNCSPKNYISKSFIEKFLSQKITPLKKTFQETFMPKFKSSHISGGTSKAPKSKIYYTFPKKSRINFSKNTFK